MTDNILNETPEPEPSRPSTPAEDQASNNPWLWVLGFLAGVTTIVGIAMYGSNARQESAYFVEDEGDPLLQMVGISLIGAGVTMAALFMVASAVCWQLERGRR